MRSGFWEGRIIEYGGETKWIPIRDLGILIFSHINTLNDLRAVSEVNIFWRDLARNPQVVRQVTLNCLYEFCLTLKREAAELKQFNVALTRNPAHQHLPLPPFDVAATSICPALDPKNFQPNFLTEQAHDALLNAHRQYMRT